MSPTESGRLTDDFCRAKAEECLHLTTQTVSRSQHVMLEHIAETWRRIADSLPANDA